MCVFWGCASVYVCAFRAIAVFVSDWRSRSFGSLYSFRVSVYRTRLS